MPSFEDIQRLWSASCLLCGEKAKNKSLDLCLACESSLPWVFRACARCAVPLTDAYTSTICGTCLRNPPAFHQAFTVFRYAPPINWLVAELKFRHRLAVAKLLGTLLAEKIETAYQGMSLPKLLLPVPLHPKRLKARGFNQALELARPAEKRLKIPLNYTVCQRIRSTVAQMALPSQQRSKNVRNAFSVTRPLDVQHVCLIDDVMTTGHTAHAISCALKRRGVQRVDVWCCARAA
jgi:ComF family protein